MRIEIQDIAYYLPDKIVSNQELKKDHPLWDMKLVEEKVGVYERHIADNCETALDLAYKACKKLFKKNNIDSIDGIIFCTQSQDYIIPSNSCILQDMLKMSNNVFALDINSACSGFIYGIAVAEGLISSKRLNNIMLVNADTYSKYINKNDRSARVLFGDAAAVTLLKKTDAEKGVIDIQFSTSGNDFKKFIIPAGGCRMPKSDDTNIPQVDNSGNVRTLENIYMDGMGVLNFINSQVPRQIKRILKNNSLVKSDIDLFVFHQSSKLTLDSLPKLLRISPNKIFKNIHDIGNTVSASIPIALKDALDSKQIKEGKKILISGFGAGLSLGSAVIQY